MLDRLRSRRRNGEDGAVAVLVSLMVLFVILPAAALGLSTYTRTGVLDEQKRAADAGALAGAASLTLANLSPANVTPLINVISPADALAHAEAVCTTARDTDKKLSSAFADPPGSATTACSAQLASQTSLQSCISNLLGPLNAVPAITIPALPPLLSGGSITVSGLLQSLIPGLFNNGVSVTVNYTVSGPIDVVLGQNGKQAAHATSVAQRRFKAVLPDLSGIPLLRRLSPAQALLVNALQVLLAQLKTIVGQLPTITPIDLHDVLVNILPAPLNALVPAISPTQPLTLPISPLSPVCTKAVIEVIEDLQDALAPDPGNTSTNLLNCAQRLVFGLNPTVPGVLGVPIATVNANCANQLFRSELTQ